MTPTEYRAAIAIRDAARAALGAARAAYSTDDPALHAAYVEACRVAESADRAHEIVERHALDAFEALP
jgi:hypothetical protein